MINQKRFFSVLFIFALVFSITCSSINYEDIGDSYAKKKDWDQAVRNFKLAVANDPNPRVQAKLEVSIKSAVKIHFRRGSSFMEKEDFHNAINEFMEVLQLQPDNQVARDSLNEAKQGKKRKRYLVKLNEGRDLIARRELTKAKTVLSSALEIVSNNSEAQAELRKVNNLINEANEYVLRGKDYLLGESWREALDSFNSALRIWVDSPEAKAGVDSARKWIKHLQHISDGKSHMNSGNLKRAFSEFTSARDIHRTQEVDSLLKAVGEKLYEPEFIKANALFSSVKTTVMPISERAEKLEKSLSMFLRAQKYMDTHDVKTSISEIKYKLSREMTDSGVAALSLHNYEFAADALTIAKRNGASVEAKLNEANYLKNLWAGYQAEANGRFHAAADNYARAREYSRTDDINLAVERVTKRTKPPQPLVLARARESGSGYETIRKDIQQRAYVSQIGKSTTISNDLIPVYTVGPELGKGVDISSLKLMNKTMEGEVREEDIFSSDTHLTEYGSLFRNYSKNTLDVDVGVSFVVFGIGANMSYSVERAAQTSKYSFDIRYEVIVKKAEITNPTVETMGDIRMDEWVRSFGTHYISEAWYGGQIIITCERKISSVQEGEEIAGKIGGQYKIFSAGVGGSRKLLEFAQQSGFKLSAKIRGGMGGVTINSVEDFFRYQDRFNREVQASSSPAIIKVRIRSYADPGINGFPFNREQFANVVDRKFAYQSGDIVTKLYDTRGTMQLAYEKRKEALRRRLDIARRRKILQKMANICSKPKFSVWQSSWIQLDLTGPDIPNSFNLVSLDIWTNNDKIQFFLLPPHVVEVSRRKGWLKKDIKFSRLGYFEGANLYRLDTRREMHGKKNLNLRLSKGEYYIFIYNYNSMASATVAFSATIGE